MVGAVVVTGVIIALFALLSNKDFGYTFQGAVAYNALTGVSTGGLPQPHRGSRCWPVCSVTTSRSR